MPNLSTPTGSDNTAPAGARVLRRHPQGRPAGLLLSLAGGTLKPSSPRVAGSLFWIPIALVVLVLVVELGLELGNRHRHSEDDNEGGDKDEWLP